MSADRLLEAADVLDFRADIAEGWLGDMPEEWRAFAAWLRAAYDDERRFAAQGAVGFQGENPAFAVARAILGVSP